MNNCPTCGSPLDPDAPGICDSCVMTPEEIAEEDNWNQRHSADSPSPLPETNR
jgi:NMD protein affecting ribosome stability and mRNA decay